MKPETRSSLVIVATVIALGIIYFTYNSTPSQLSKKDPLEETSTPTSTSIPTTSYHETAERETQQIQQLEVNLGAGWKPLSNDFERNPFDVSENYLVTANPRDFRIQVFALNLKTGEEIVVFNEIGEPEFRGIGQIKIIGQTLFFSTNEYMGETAMYAVNFPLETNRPVKINSMMNPSIIEIGKRYWMFGGFGDSCVAFGGYDLFDPVTRKTRNIGANYGYECGPGNTLAITEDAVLKFHFITTGEEGVMSEDRTFTHITMIDLNNISRGETSFISKEEMPKDIKDVEYDETSHSLVLTGKTPYVFDLNTNTLTQKAFAGSPGWSRRGKPMDAKKKIDSLILPPNFRITTIEVDR